MTILVFEKPDSRKASGAFSSRKISREYGILNASTELEATNELLAFVPETVDGLVIDAPDVKEVYPGIWDASMVWITPTKKDQQEQQQKEEEPGDFVVSFDTTGGTTNRKRAYALVSIHGANAPNPGLTIGVTKDGVEGVDVTIPAYSWTEEWTVAKAHVNSSYTRKLRDLTGTVNAFAFRGFKPHEVRFDGASGQKQGDKWKLTFKFTVSKEEKVDITDEEPFTAIPKRGWDYIWCRFTPKVDTSAKAMTQGVEGAYVQQVYREADFADLGIGTEELTL